MVSNHADTAEEIDDVQEQTGKSLIYVQKSILLLCKNVHNCLYNCIQSFYS